MKIKQWFAAHKPSKRKIIQLYAALLFNANLKGFVKGEIYQGPMKNICAPGLNCYSCPGASAACPLGALQNALSSANHHLPYYMFGILMLYGLLLGRWICGFLCPFGWIQELFHKIKTPKLKKSRVTRVLSYFKYVILALFVVVFPLLYAVRNVPLPGFCKYICPAGTLEGAMGLLSNKLNEGYLAMLGPLFTWKFVLLVGFILGSIFIFRFFCRFFCPLGAIYGFFNKIALFGVKLDKQKCTDCGLCVEKCQMDIRHVGDHECINCGECMSVCPTKAIQWKGSKFVLPLSEVDGPIVPSSADEAAAIEARNAKILKRNKKLKVVVGVAMIALLVGVLIYYNVDFSSDEPAAETTEGESATREPATEPPPETLPDAGNEVGALCPSSDIPLVGRDEVFNVANNTEKITVISFWHSTDELGVQALPYLDRISFEFAEDVQVVSIHAATETDLTDWISAHYPETNMLFGLDADNAYRIELIGTAASPVTLVLDERGVILAKLESATVHETLKAEVEAAITARNDRWAALTAETETMPEPLPEVGVEIGKLCPSIERPLFNGDSDTFDTGNTGGKITILNFWFTSCTPCLAELPYFNSIANDYADKVQIIALHADMPNVDVPKWLDANTSLLIEAGSGDPLALTLGWDTDNALYKRFGFKGTYPATVILDERGVIVQKIVTALDYTKLQEIIDNLLTE